MSWYTFGTATIANGAKAVTLSAGNTALANVRSGDMICFGSNPGVEVDTVNTNTSLTLKDNWPFTTVTAGTFKVFRGPAWNAVSALSGDVAAYLAMVSGLTSSDSTLTVGTGSKVFRVPASHRFGIGARVRATDNADVARWMEGLVSGYADGQLTVTVDLTNGTGSASVWNINHAGERGAPGVTGDTGATGATGPAAWTTVAAWAATTAYAVGPPASVVTHLGETYVCTTSHTSTGAFDASKFSKVAAKGADAAGLTDGDKGDIIVSGSGAVFTLDVSGVSAGDYTNVNVTVDAKGRVTAIASSFDALAYHGLQVNGFQQISQENGSSAVSAGQYPVDQESFGSSGPTCTAQRAAFPFTSRLDIPWGIKIEATTGAGITTSTNIVFTSSAVEGERLRGRLNWGSAIASPLKIGRVIRSNVSGRGYCSVRNGTANRSYVVPFDVVANTDTWVEITIPGDTVGTWAIDNTAGLMVAWAFGVGSAYQTTANTWASGNYVGASDCTNFFATTGNKVWLGPMVVLAGLELPTFAQIMKCQRHYSDELADCRRYWEASYSIGVAPGTVTLVGATYMVTQGTLSYHSLPPFAWIEKRATPTVTIYSPNTGATSKMWKQGVGDINSSITGVGTRGGTAFVNGVSVGPSEGLYQHYKADARM